MAQRNKSHEGSPKNPVKIGSDYSSFAAAVSGYLKARFCGLDRL
ncbi:hypothetical protein HMPREF9371_1582 [Neisseria shayeganii 871]|uniref:Uncharacterized protein n=1 Tax=Neisseria shayeganii 871 TaxID=1032488 RepID=G4CIZ3_9NEIS|nr:hypothetical protein HMPREF9371_1582 [Neisseria shayeganii 871]